MGLSVVWSNALGFRVKVMVLSLPSPVHNTKVDDSQENFKVNWTWLSGMVWQRKILCKIKNEVGVGRFIFTGLFSIDGLDSTTIVKGPFILGQLDVLLPFRKALDTLLLRFGGSRISSECLTICTYIFSGLHTFYISAFFVS